MKKKVKKPYITMTDSQKISYAIFYPLFNRIALLWMLLLAGLLVGGIALFGPAIPIIGDESFLQSTYKKLVFSLDINVQASRSKFPLAYSLSNYLAMMLGMLSGVIAGFVQGDISAFRRSVSDMNIVKRMLMVVFSLFLISAPLWLEMTPNHLQPSFYLLEQIKNDRFALFIWVEVLFFTDFCVIFYCLLEFSNFFKGARHAS